MFKGSTLLPKVFTVLLALMALAVSILIFPSFAYGIPHLVPDYAWYQIPFTLGLYGGVALFFGALWFALQLLRYVDKGCAFSQLSVRTLGRIKICAALVSACLYAGVLPVAYWCAQMEDAPGIVLVALAFTSVPLIVATFADVLQKLLHEAVEIKTENELTV